MARSLALAVALLALAVAVATAASQQPNAQVFDKTATGQPVISANANEIVNVHDENEDTSKASLEKEADETLHQLKITKQLEAKRRAERREKHAEEQAFKTREAENKQDHLQIHQEKFKDHMSKKAEEGTKTAEEARAKSAAKVDLENKLSEKKKEKKLDAVRKAAKIDQLHIDNARKVWETSMELKRKHIYEEQSKSKERVGKAMEERATKKRTREGARKRKREMHAKSENHAKNKEADSKRHREQHNKREVRRAAARAAEASEEQQKSALDQRDRQHEEAFKAARAAKERQKKALEEAKKRAERREKLRERNEKAAEKEKKRQEQEAKEGAKKAAHRAEQHEKAKRRAERQQKEQQKKWRMNAQLNWCHCNYVYKPWGSYNNAWFTCGGQSLLIGWHRYWAQDLSAISHLHCCHACRPNGQVMKTENCHSADWVRSFDVQGWSFCPKDHYIKGFYKSSCNWIYCLEYAMCCKIEGSRSYKACSTLSRWVHQNDYAGWKSLDGNHFMVGLYRSSGHYLYNIEQPQQCTANAYND